MVRCGFTAGLFIVGYVTILAGCGSKSPAGTSKDAEFKALVTLYSSLIKHGRAPTSEAEFKDAIKNRLAPVAQALKVGDVDALFTSSRDGKPVVVIYGKRSAGMSQDVVAYEQVGVDGKRLVGYSLGMVEEVDEARFRELVPASGGGK